ncbi:uncharacterized protein RB166_010430 [Leptodactylus fuscus]|uniref:uncharacterized protein LOC142210464 n=1 Tax=Leptodactylus fuscus TaxID=238119 RepID=UPI003F4E6660
MATSGFAASLLFLGLVVSNAYGNTTMCENILSTFHNASLSNFNFTVSPATLSSKALYTVTLDGHSSFTEVLFQAVSQDIPEGTWTQASSTCNGSGLFTNPFVNSTHFQTTWLSPENVTSVTIYAYLHNGTDTFRVHETLSQAVNNTTTAAPTASSNQTEHPQSSSTVTVSTHSVTMTTSAGSTQQSSLVSLALSVILGLLLIPNKYLQ